MTQCIHEGKFLLKERMRMPKVNTGVAVMSNTTMIAKATATIMKLLLGIILNCHGITMAKRKKIY